MIVWGRDHFAVNLRPGNILFFPGRQQIFFNADSKKPFIFLEDMPDNFSIRFRDFGQSASV